MGFLIPFLSDGWDNTFLILLHPSKLPVFFSASFIHLTIKHPGTVQGLWKSQIPSSTEDHSHVPGQLKDSGPTFEDSSAGNMSTHTHVPRRPADRSSVLWWYFYQSDLNTNLLTLPFCKKRTKTSLGSQRNPLPPDSLPFLKPAWNTRHLI